MKALSGGLPRIIHDTVKFSCFLGFVHGTVEVSVYDDGTKVFPAVVTVDTNRGSGSLSLKLKGNESFKKTIKGIDVEVTISEWHCTNDILKFHVKATAKKGILSCTIVDKSFEGKRHQASAFDLASAHVLEQAEKLHGAS